MSTQNQVTNAVHATINGEKHLFDSPCTLEDVLKALSLEPERVAIELNRAIVKRELWRTTAIDSGAEIEIVQFVGGG